MAIRQILMLLAVAMMLYGSSVFVDRLYTLGNNARDIPAPKWLLTATMPLGFVLLDYRFLEAGWQLLHGEGDEEAEEQDS